MISVDNLRAALRDLGVDVQRTRGSSTLVATHGDRYVMITVVNGRASCVVANTDGEPDQYASYALNMVARLGRPIVLAEAIADIFSDPP